MLIYRSEIAAGLADIIKGNRSISYCTEIKSNSTSNTESLLNKYPNLRTAAKLDNFDLYPIESLLVSSLWNKNDDIFDKIEMWSARSTPEDKPLNFNHEPLNIIGHIVSNRVVNGDLEEINDSVAVEDLPDKIHIITKSVLYKALDNPEYLERMSKLIPQIEAGEWYVSMECLFNGFDYGVEYPDGKQSIIPRSEASAFLTKHLRSYGGTGTYENFKIGRLLRNITFSGHGLVEKPANPESIIFNNSNNFSATSNSIVYLTESNVKSCEMEKHMDDKELEKENATLKATIERLEAQLKQVSTEASQAQITALTAEINDYKSKYSTLEAAVNTANDAVTKATSERDEAIAAKDKMEKDFKSMKDEKTKAQRIAAALGLHATAEQAEAFVSEYIALADDMFGKVLSLAAMSWKQAGGQQNTYQVGEKGEAKDMGNPDCEEKSKEGKKVKGNTDDDDDEDKYSEGTEAVENAVAVDKGTSSVDVTTAELHKAVASDIDSYITSLMERDKSKRK